MSIADDLWINIAEFAGPYNASWKYGSTVCLDAYIKNMIKVGRNGEDRFTDRVSLIHKYPGDIMRHKKSIIFSLKTTTFGHHFSCLIDFIHMAGKDNEFHDSIIGAIFSGKVSNKYKYYALKYVDVKRITWKIADRIQGRGMHNVIKYLVFVREWPKCIEESKFPLDIERFIPEIGPRMYYKKMKEFGYIGHNKKVIIEHTDKILVPEDSAEDMSHFANIAFDMNTCLFIPKDKEVMKKIIHDPSGKKFLFYWSREIPAEILSGDTISVVQKYKKIMNAFDELKLSPGRNFHEHSDIEMYRLLFLAYAKYRSPKVYSPETMQILSYGQN